MFVRDVRLSTTPTIVNESKIKISNFLITLGYYLVLLNGEIVPMHFLLMIRTYCIQLPE